MEIISSNPKQYCRLSLLKTKLNIQDDVQDEYLKKIIEQNSSVIDTLTNREFNEQIVKETFHNVRGMVLLNITPIKKINSIIADNRNIEDYIVLEDSGIVLIYGTFSRVEVTYEAGFDTNEENFEIPRDIEKACLELCLYQINGERQVLSEKIGDYQVQYQDALNVYQSVNEILKNWRRIE